MWSARLKSEKLIKINQFNNLRQFSEGKFTVGFWTGLTESNLFSIDDTDMLRVYIAKALQGRQNKCEEIAAYSLKNGAKGFTQSYEDCMVLTR